MIVTHAPNDPILGTDTDRAFIAEYQFLDILRRASHSANPYVPNAAAAYNFVNYICHTFKSKIEEPQRERINQLAHKFFRFINIEEFFNTKELVYGLKQSGVKNTEIADRLGFKNRSMVNYYMSLNEKYSMRSHISNWGQLQDIELFLKCCNIFLEAFNGQKYTS